MKKILLLLTLAAGLNVATNAQDKPVSFGVKAGVAFPNLVYSAEGMSASADAKTSFYVGAIADINVSEIFSVQPGLTFMNKGTKSDALDAGASINFSYLELPVNLVANFNAGPGKFFLGAGPYAAYALSGNSKVDGEKYDAEFGSGEEQVKRMDFGVNFLTGYKLTNGLNLHVGYGLGLGNLSNISENGTDLKIKNKVFSVGLGFNF
ncbi:porin family protein [Pedobacter xixiisoli]|uniref:Outer membrane protein beta-barrel domain-containing protein n=1 Tax=Pedobacter xixiisoli TaxID=1476464 RepID=A0A285ZZV9_9SPHI|nr:porin family protein [Pedobacter xixiisoli]SOD15192.1 Outer membrane protein beta-barrel domain-containing protein [Pedobacter xixiisoli]